MVPGCGQHPWSPRPTLPSPVPMGRLGLLIPPPQLTKVLLVGLKPLGASVIAHPGLVPAILVLDQGQKVPTRLVRLPRRPVRASCFAWPSIQAGAPMGPNVPKDTCMPATMWTPMAGCVGLLGTGGRTMPRMLSVEDSPDPPCLGAVVALLEWIPRVRTTVLVKRRL